MRLDKKQIVTDVVLTLTVTEARNLYETLVGAHGSYDVSELLEEFFNWFDKEAS
jgi:hypothetical protein